MVKPITEMEKLEKKMIQFAREEDSVRLLARFGSRLDDTFDLLSDLDFFILAESVEGMHKDLDRLKPYYKLRCGNRAVLFFIPDGEEYDVRKIDVTISKDFKEIYRLLKEGDNLLNAIIVDKEDKYKLDESFLKEREEKFAQIAEEHIDRFIEAFENLSIAFQSSDEFRFMRHQSIAIYHLHILAYMIENGLKLNYLPKQSTRTKSEILQAIGTEITDTNSNLSEGRETKKILLKKFKLVFEAICREHDLDIDQTKVLNLLDRIVRRDWIWNLRDVSDIDPSRINSRILLRSPSLHVYTRDHLLDESFTRFKIRSVIDIRTIGEVEMQREQKLEGIKHYHIPIGAKKNKGDAARVAGYIDSYQSYPKIFKKEIADIFRLLLNAPKPILVHCHVGTDRTGIVIAILYKMLGIPDDAITRDYLSSRYTTRVEKIEKTLEVIHEVGESSYFRDYLKLEESEISQIRALFLKKHY